MEYEIVALNCIEETCVQWLGMYHYHQDQNLKITRFKKFQLSKYINWEREYLGKICL